MNRSPPTLHSPLSRRVRTRISHASTRWSSAPKTMCARATFSRSCCRSGFRRLRPARFALYRACGASIPRRSSATSIWSFQIVCSSPEILVRVRDGKVTIRPIAGTRWRGKTKAEDNALAKDLLADEKECAEHLMLLDLGRNNVGRVAKIGTVSVTEQFAIERYSHVMHIVSNVEGRLGAGRRHRRALRRLSRRHGLGRAESAGDGDHRRTRDRQARRLWRLHRLFRRSARWTPASSCAPRSSRIA